MKPVDKGGPPRGADGAEILYTGEEGHRNAKRELHRRLGRFCSYCERRGDLHVEHVIPKRKHPTVRHLWNNYLLACHNCNAIKAEKDPLTDEWDCLFPDEVNTAWAFAYGPGALIGVNKYLSQEDTQRAKNTIQMVGLDRRPGADLDPADKDLR